ncbi:E3 ubiquitin-protein ligase listerin [Cercospora zeina]
MSKRGFKSQASSGRVGGFGGFGGSAFASGQSSVLSYIQEPTDYSAVSNPSVVVAFKNLSKKDSTTKAKALEDLQASLSATEDIEDAIIEVWVKQYPRLSIDTARRVRQLAHHFTGQLSVKCGKRIAKQLSKITGPWLAGTFDSDRSVAKAAEEALTTVFPTPEKINGLRKTFQESILQYCQDAALNETVGTLSDERSVSADDAKATHARVVAPALLTISSLLRDLPSAELDKQKHVYEALFSDKKFWDFVTHPDPNVRKATNQLVQLCLQQEPDLVEKNLSAASSAYIYDGLASDHTGASLSFVETLDALTTTFPSIWTTAYSKKKPALGRLRQCLKHGSSGGPAQYWNVLAQVLRKLPDEVLPKTYDDISDLLLSARDGICKREERFNSSSSWPVYFTLVDIVTRTASDEDATKLFEAFVMPLIMQYLQPASSTEKWTISGPKPASIVSKVGRVSKLPPVLEQQWPQLAASLVETAKLSQPERSKDFDKSQKHVATIGERWADLQRELFANDYGFPESLIAGFIQANTDVLRECVVLLESRNGKPWGAAAVVEQQLRSCASHLLRDPAYHQTLFRFVEEILPQMILSPSQRPLVRCLFAMQDDAKFGVLFEAALQRILEPERSGANSQERLNALHVLFPANTPSAAVKVAQENSQLQNFLKEQTATHDALAYSTFADLLRLGVVPQSTSEIILVELTKLLSLNETQTQSGLSGIEHLSRTNESVVRNFMSTSSGEQMLPTVIQLKDSASDSVAESASAVANLLTSSFAEATSQTKYALITQSLEKTSPSSLPIETVLELSHKISSGETDDQNLREMLPSTEIWRDSILAITPTPKASLALLSPLGGAVHLLPARQLDSEPSYDSDGLSRAFRIAIFFANFLKSVSISTIPGRDAAHVLAHLNICVLLAEDATSIFGANALWREDQPHVFEHEVMTFIVDANEVLRTYWSSVDDEAKNKHETDLFAAFDTLISDHKGSPVAYYAALAAAKARENAFEFHGYTSAQSKAGEEELRAKRSGKDSIALVSYIVGFAQALTGSQLLTRMCNEFVADLTQNDPEVHEDKVFEQLVLLNTILHTQPDIVDSIAKPRLIFLVKHIIPWLSTDASLRLKAETCKVLGSLLPAMADMYGEHWSQIVGVLVSFWRSAANAPQDRDGLEEVVLVSHGTLKLYAALSKLSRGEEPNDDLVEAMKESEGALREGLISLLKAGVEVPDAQHQPLMITNELLARQILQLPAQPLNETEDLFPLLCAPSQALQSAAFDLLHKHIPKAQEQISLDAALENRKAFLPDELLSLIMQAPDLDTLDEDAFELVVPLTLQGYLYGWRLVFDHFQGSSFRVQGDYVEQLRENGYLNGLLEMSFDILRLSSGRPVDASNFELQNYTPGLEANPEKETQALLTHLYYQSLLHLSSLVKNYLNNEIRSRQAPKTIEAWTAKYISPLIISHSLAEVTQWNEKTVQSDPDYEPMSVKVNPRAREITVSYQIDEQTMAMKIVIPEAYPLQSAKPESINRVAVSEQKWRAWLINCQGTITFSNNHIPPALSTWRKNVAAALKGHDECAICYSMVNEHKELPKKRCPTCKHTFHNACLFKWFRSSNSSTCPLCRQPYHYN